MTRIKKAVAAAAATLCMSAPAMAQVSIYGTLDVSIGQFQAAGAVKNKMVESGNMTTSFIGFKGSEDLGGGLKANFAIEHFLGVDTGTAGRFPLDKFWARSAWVGLSGGFGSTMVGRTTNQFFISTLLFNAFGDSFGFSPAIRQTFIASGVPGLIGDSGWSNSAVYSSPNFGGLSFNLQANTKDAPDAGTGRNVGGNVLYFGGPLSATVAVQKVKNATNAPADPGFEGQTSVLLGGAYDLKVVKLFGEYITLDTQATTDTDSKIIQLGVTAPLAGGTLMAQYGRATGEVGTAKTTSKILSVGYTYFLSKRTDVYAVYMNDKLTGASAGNTLAGGMRVRF